MIYSAELSRTNLPDDSNHRPSGTLTQIQNHLAGDLHHVHVFMMAGIQSSVPIIPQLANHLIAAGGKRVRPIIMLLAAYLFEQQPDIKRISRLAACVEFIHVATLLHDDVIDESDLRRGRATANSIWGNKNSVLVGDFLFSRAFQFMVQDGCLDVLKLLSDTATQISEGEIKQQISVGNPKISEQEYFDIAAAKTAPLFEAAAQVPALITNAEDHQKNALMLYGRYLGITFQIVDDILDYASSHQDMGKNSGDDFREGKITLPVILAYQNGNDIQQAFWRRTMTDMSQTPADFTQALCYLNENQVFNQAYDRAVNISTQAQQALDCFPPSQAKHMLIDLVTFALQRLH